MEERLGIRLMNRTTRSVALTEAGELLLARVAPAMSDVTEALNQVRGLRHEPSGRLRINAPPPAIDLVLAPLEKRTRMQAWLSRSRGCCGLACRAR